MIMNIKIKISLLITLIISTVVFSNFKERETIENYPPLSSLELTEYLHGGSSKTWKATAFSLMGVINLQKCRLDDVITLKSDQTFQYDGGEDLCGREDNLRLRSGKWQVSEDGQKLIFEYEKNRKRKKTERYQGHINNAGDGWIVLGGDYKGIEIKATYFAH